MIYELRHYQQQAVNKIMDSIAHHPHSNPLCVVPCGAGKSLIIATLVSKLIDKQILVCTPRKKLLQQNATYIADHGVCSSAFGDDTGHEHNVILGTYQTLINRDIKAPDIIIVDECHLVPEDDSAYAALLAQYPDAIVIGLTATPFRGRKQIFEGSKARWRKVYEIDILTLIEQGYLVGVHSVPGFGDDSEYSTLNDDADLEARSASAIHQAIRINTSDQRNAILVFARDISHAVMLTQFLTDAGEAAFIVHSKQPEIEQEQAFRLFSNPHGRRWLVNVGMLTTGVDLPFVDAIVLMRHISSIALYIQIVGRGMRVHPNKRDCLLSDFADNVNRHGCIDDLVFDQIKLSGAGNGAKPCPNCRAFNPLVAKTCSRCGEAFSFKLHLNDLASHAPVLSRDIRVSKVISVNVAKTDNVYLHSIATESGDNVTLVQRSVKTIGTGTKISYERIKDEHFKLLRLIS
ncbi:DEAD/DEAH box helicase [Motilimonas eburnea]|uniref:DEAD/DEAH box helicase n=1 Tax=Motilimonas eburnea TaxID=1737488 RepID=UPI001E5E25AF|nr:DEAD/DEAH box helicase [Motilimonas eburnea]MCE2571753.1 DEAD/DEAH box helicase [Motilimonas eburnea]